MRRCVTSQQRTACREKLPLRYDLMGCVCSVDHFLDKFFSNPNICAEGCVYIYFVVTDGGVPEMLDSR